MGTGPIRSSRKWRRKGPKIDAAGRSRAATLETVSNCGFRLPRSLMARAKAQPCANETTVAAERVQPAWLESVGQPWARPLLISQSGFAFIAAGPFFVFKGSDVRS